MGKQSKSKPWLGVFLAVGAIGGVSAAVPDSSAPGKAKTEHHSTELASYTAPTHNTTTTIKVSNKGLPPLLVRIRFCESTDNYNARNPERVYWHGKYIGNASGGFQIVDDTWRSYNKKYKHAMDAPRAVQDDVATRLYADQGTGPWAASKSCWSKS